MMKPAKVHPETSLTAIDYGLMVSLLLVAMVTLLTSVWTWFFAGA